MTPDFDETEAARLALEEVWRRLAPVVDEARHKQLEVVASPTLQENPSVDALVRWLSIFDRELGAVQAVYEAANAGARLTPEELYTARKVAEKLMNVIDEVPEAVAEVQVPDEAIAEAEAPEAIAEAD